MRLKLCTLAFLLDAEPCTCWPAVSKLDGLQAGAADAVRAYFGMRKISLGVVGDETNLRPLLNNKFIFHMGMLDQVSCPLTP